MTKRLVVIDGKSVFYRGYYAMPGLSTKQGTPTGGVYGFATLAIEIIKKLEPDYVCVAWDKKGTSIRRRLQLLPTYKAGRKKPPADFFAQIPVLHQLLEALGWPLLEADDYEADDIMGTLAAQAEAAGVETCLVTSDLDMLQLVSPLTKVYALKRGLAHIEQYDPATLEAKLGVAASQFLDMKALKGDASDNIPGVPGVGEKTAVALLQQYGTLDAIYEHIADIKPAWAKKLIAGKDSAYLSRQVATIWCDAPVAFDRETMDITHMDPEQLRRQLVDLEFTSLLGRLPAHLQASQAPAGLYVPTRIQPLMVQPLPTGDGSDELVVPNQPALIYVAAGQLWLSTRRSQVYTAALDVVPTSVWQRLAQACVVGYDVKSTLHALAQAGVRLTITKLHDICQAAFLLSPLARDRSLTALAGQPDDAVPADDPGAVMAALWNIYDAQTEALAAQPRLARIATEFDFPLVPVLFAMEERGVGIDQQVFAELHQQLSTEYQQLVTDIHKLVGYEFNIASPAQLSQVLFTKLQLPTTGIKKGKTGYSTGQKELDKLRGQHPIIELIERSRELAKMLSTYVDALPRLVGDDGRIHTTFHQDVTATGRLSSTHPNLQNIPIRSQVGRQIRRGFTARPGHVLVSADYSQFELRLAAVLAGDEALIADFNNGVDIHTKTASQVYGVAMDQVSAQQRRHAKVINFGVLYGMSPHGLAAATGMSIPRAKQFIDDYFALRAPIRAYIDATLEHAKTAGYVETYFGRRRPTPDVASSNYLVREAARRASANMPIQGTEADLMKRAMIAVEKGLAGLGQQILQIHDSILVECPAGNATQVADLLQTTMEQIAPELPIRLQVDVHTGTDWGEL